jgi:large subunit ribosomal protein L14
MQNAVILLDKKLQPIGTRLFGPVAKEVRVKKYNKLSTIARFVV